MCVRYTLHKSDAALAAITRALKRQLAAPEWVVPRYNVTLTQTMPVVAAGDEGPEIRTMRWGLIAFFEREKTPRQLLPNAKAGSLAADEPADRHTACCREQHACTFARRANSGSRARHRIDPAYRHTHATHCRLDQSYRRADR